MPSAANERGRRRANIRRRRSSRASPRMIFRHTAASLAIISGANVKAVQRMLGHSSASMTLDIYADLFDDDLERCRPPHGRKCGQNGADGGQRARHPEVRSGPLTSERNPSRTRAPRRARTILAPAVVGSNSQPPGKPCERNRFCHDPLRAECGQSGQDRQTKSVSVLYG
ncbi:tyrosine-type recombinase/integrase [Rhodococcus hoagii]|nr:tyrosine-type recombinase/integrase [Prescottella equi]